MKKRLVIFVKCLLWVQKGVSQIKEETLFFGQ